MEIINISQQKSIINQFISEIRDSTIQKDCLRFRKNIERIGEAFAFEIAKKLDYLQIDTRTPLGIAKCENISDEIVIASIMRAALPLHYGILNVFDKAHNSFIGAFRKYGKDNKFKIEVEYASVPEIDGKVLILADTMLATGSSIFLAYQRICKDGHPKHTHIVCPISSSAGVDYLKQKLGGENITLWVGSIDEELTNKSYIIPGLGDAGDLAFGPKL